MRTIRVLGIDADELQRMLVDGRDDDGNAIKPFASVSGGEPLRCCLRDAEEGERIALAAYRPVRRSVRDVGGNDSNPYHESGPVFVHAEGCSGPADDDYPDQWRARTQVFRCYDRDGRILGGTVVSPGDGQEAALGRLFDDPAVAFVHTRNVVYGCFMADVRRS